MHTSTTVVIACVLTAALAGARPNPNVAPDVVQDYKYEYDYSMTLTSGFNGSGHTQQWPGWIKTSKKSRECEKCITVESDVKGSLKSLWFQPWESSMYVSLFKDTKCHTTPLAVYHGRYVTTHTSSIIRNAASLHVCHNSEV